jgi:hypothetical protein
MKTIEAIGHFGTVLALSKALGITRQAIYQWGESVPYKHQYRLQYLTNGKLIAAPPDKAA